MTTPPFNVPAISTPYGNPFGKVIGAESVVAGFVPTDIASLFLWLDAEQGITLNGPDVAGWADQSGNGNLAFQGSASKQPFFNSTGIGSKPSVAFDASTFENMEVPDSPSIDITSSFTFYVVCNALSDAEAHFISRNQNLGYRWRLITGFKSAVIISDDGVGFEQEISPGSISSATDVILEVHYQVGGTVNFTQNGVALGGAQVNALSGVFSNSAILFIGSITAVSSFFDGDIAQILLYSTLLSTADRNNNISYLGNRYGISTTLIP